MNHYVIATLFCCLLLLIFKPKKEIIPVDITVYQPVISQTNSRPWETSDGSKINLENPQKWIAVSPDLYYLRGKKVLIRCKCPFDGEVREVRDKMNARYEKSIDILTSEGLGKWGGVIIL